MKTAKELQPGDKIQMEDGTFLRAVDVRPANGFRIDGPGGPKLGIWVDLPNKEWVILHPAEEVVTA